MNKIVLLICILLIVLPFGHLLAQPAFDPSISDVPAPGGGAGAPLDGGLGLLIAAGIGYSARNLKRKNKYSEADIKAIEKYICK